MPETSSVTGAEFLRRLKATGKARGIEVSYEKERGKGSHGMLYYGGRRTTVKDLKKELGPGLFRVMLKQLGLTAADIQKG